MANPNPMYIPKPLSLQHLRSLRLQSDQVGASFLVRNMPWDYFYRHDDFDQAIDTNFWTTAVTAGGAPTAFAYNAQRVGALRGATGTTANGVTAVYGNLVFDAADKPLMIARLKFPAAVTSLVYEVGFVSAPTDTKLVNVSDVDTPAFGNGVTDGIVVTMDTAQTLTTSALVGDGTTGAAVKTNIGTYTPTVSKWVVLVIGFLANQGFASVWDNGVYIGSYNVTNGPDSGIAMQPYVMFKTLNTTSKTVDIDCVTLVAERNAT